MKKVYLFMCLLAATATFTACSSDDVTTGKDTTDEGINGTSYLSVKIAMPDGSTRAGSATDGGYSNGSTNESYVKEAQFLFYDASGNYLTSGKTITVDASSSTPGQTPSIKDETVDIELQKEATVVLGPTTIKPGSTIKMVTLLNYQGTFDDLKNKSLNDVLAVTTKSTLTKDDAASNKGLFEMSTSSYVGTSGVMQYTEIPAEKFYSSKSLAEAATAAGANAVDVYVERTVAKVGMGYKKGTNATTSEAADATTSKPYVSGSTYYYPMTTDGITYTVDNENIQLAVQIVGWRANAVNLKGKLLKDITNGAYKSVELVSSEPKDRENGSNVTKEWSLAEWNYSGNHRSYWAEDVNYGDGTDNDGINATNGDGENDYLKYYKFNEVTTVPTSEYVYENTVDQAKAQFRGEDDANVTTILIAAKVGKWTPSEDTKFTEFTNLYRKDGLFYTSVSKLAAYAFAGLYKDSNHTEAITETDFVVDESELNTSLINLKTSTEITDADASSLDKIGQIDITVQSGGMTVYDANGEAVTTATLNARLADAYYYKNGDCFYQVPIEHPVLKSSTDNTRAIYGVVRNHSYVLTLNSISNLGAPINNENTPIVPIPGKDTYYYAAAQVNVLAWRDVENQSVDL